MQYILVCIIMSIQVGFFPYSKYVIDDSIVQI